MSNLPATSLLRSIATEISKLTADDCIRVFGTPVTLGTAATIAGIPFTDAARVSAIVAGAGSITHCKTKSDSVDSLVDSARNAAGLLCFTAGAYLYLTETCSPLSKADCTAEDFLRSATAIALGAEFLICGPRKEMQTQAQAALALPETASADELYRKLKGE